MRLPLVGKRVWLLVLSALPMAGGNFWPSDFSLPVGGSVELFLADSTCETIVSGGPGAFRGFITPRSIGFLIIDAPDRWPTLDNLIVGSAR